MDLSQAAIQEIAKLVHVATKTEALDEYTILTRDSEGGVESVRRNDKPHTTIVYSIEDVVKNCQSYEDAWEIYYSRRCVRGFMDLHRRHSVTMNLTKSPAFEQLCEWDKKPQQLKQDEFTHLLKTKFRRCCDETISRIIGTLKWTIGNTGESNVKHTGVSINKSIVAEMSGADDLNKIEYVTFEVPVFIEIPTVTARVECHLRPIPEHQLFIVTPTGGEIENAYRKAESAIRDLVMQAVGDTVGTPPVYHGYANADCADAPKL